MNWKLITPPSSEPVSAADVRAQARVDSSTEDATTIAMYITAAREQAEKYQGRAIGAQTIELSLDAFPSFPLKLPMAPLVSLTSVSVTDSEGSATSMSTSDFVVDTYAEPGRIHMKSAAQWPSVSLQEIGGIKIRYVAGAAASVSQKLAILMVAAYWFENREAAVEVPKAIEGAFRALLDGDRIVNV